jgi:cytochrome c oxidase subunit II
MKLLILLVVVIGVIAIAQLAKVYELTAKLRKTREEDISFADNRLNANLWMIFMVVFYASTIFLYIRYGNYLPVSASAHGEDVDALMSFNIILITAMFFVVNTMLFYFSAKYYYRKDRKAKFFPHDNKLEMIWTIIPSIVLAVIIIYGLRTWNNMTGPASPDALRVEIYGKQFDWTARYAGEDMEFGLADYNLITPTNPLGIVTAQGVAESLAEIDTKIAALQDELTFELGHIQDRIDEINAQINEQDDHGHSGHDEHAEEDHGDHGHGSSKEELESRIAELEEMKNSTKASVLSEVAYEAKEDKLYRLKRHKQRILDVERFDYTDGTNAWDAGKDDNVVKGEFHLPLGREVEFVFRSRDVIHSAYMPHFRTQMNCVPGVPTRFKMTPTITTDSMRMVMDDPEFNYILLCNKVCGAAHFNMQMKVIVDTPEQYEAWIKKQKTFFVAEPPEDTEQTDPATEENVETAETSTETAVLLD